VVDDAGLLPLLQRQIAVGIVYVDNGLAVLLHVFALEGTAMRMLIEPLRSAEARHSPRAQ
jgi:hypothetical protein